jgi:hypothetical protein
MADLNFHNRQRPIVAVLGCSFSAYDYNPAHKSWVHFLSEEYPHIDIVNFARSGHGFDYSRFVLNWMGFVNYKPDLIIMNIPPLNRKFQWGTNNNKYEFEFAKDFFLIEHATNNIYDARPAAPRINYGSDIFVEDDSPYFSKFEDIIKRKHKPIFEDHVFNTELHVLDHYMSSKTLGAYEQLLDCKIFYYMYHRQGPWDPVTNFSVVQYPTEFLPKRFPKKNIFISENDNHLNTDGNKIFYDVYIKNDKNITTALKNLT